jgi:hypothetical protein
VQPGPEAARTVSPGELINAEAGGDVARYDLRMSLGQLLHIVVDHGFVDLTVDVPGPNGLTPRRCDGAGYGHETVSMVTDTTSVYRLAIAPAVKSAPREPYSLMLRYAHSPSASDLQCSAAYARTTEIQTTGEPGQIHIAKYGAN